MAKLKECKIAQDGHTAGETRVYDEMWKRAKGTEGGSRRLSIGHDRLARNLRSGRANVRKHCERLIEKLSIRKIADPILAERVGTTYEVFSYIEIIERRRCAGLTHFVSDRGSITLVDPNNLDAIAKLIQIDTGVNLTPDPICERSADVRHSAASGVNLIPVSGVNLIPDIRYQSDTALGKRASKEGEGTSTYRHQVSNGLVVADPLPIRAASKEPPVEMLFLKSPIAGSLLSNREGHVEGVSIRSKKEDPATVSLGGSPSTQGQDTPELTSSPKSWAGRQQNQPTATKQTSSPVPLAPFSLKLAMVVVDEEEDEATWKARVEAEEDLADGGSYPGTKVDIPAPMEAALEPTVDPDAWIGQPSADDEPPYTTVADKDDIFSMGPTGPARLDAINILVQHAAADLQAARDAEHDANMARINREMAEAELTEAAQAAETMPEPVAPRILPLAEPVENAVMAAEPVAPAFPVETRQELRVRVIAYLVGLPHRCHMPAAEIHAAIRPAMDVFDLDSLLQYLGCNGEIDIFEMGRREYEFRAHEPDEPLDSVEEPAVDSMAWLSGPRTYPACTPAVDDDNVFTQPGLPESPEFPDVQSLRAQDAQDRLEAAQAAQCGRDALNAAEPSEQHTETGEGPVTPEQVPVTAIDIRSMPPGLSWPETVVEYVRRGGQDLVAIAAAIDQPLASIQNVVRFDGDIHTRYEHGRPHYYVLEPKPTVPVPTDTFQDAPEAAAETVKDPEPIQAAQDAQVAQGAAQAIQEAAGAVEVPDKDLVASIDAKILAAMAAGKSGYVPIAAEIGSDRDTVAERQKAMLADCRLVMSHRDEYGSRRIQIPEPAALAPAAVVVQKSGRRDGESLHQYWMRCNKRPSLLLEEELYER